MELKFSGKGSVKDYDIQWNCKKKKNERLSCMLLEKFLENRRS